MNSFSNFLEQRDPELYDEILNEINWKGLAAGALATSASGQEKPYEPFQKPVPTMQKPDQSVQKNEIELSDPQIDQIDIQGNLFTKISFDFKVPKNMLSPEKGTARYVKYLLVKKFQSDKLLGLNPYSTVRVSINDQAIQAKNAHDLIKKALNPHDAGLDNFKFKENNTVTFYIPKIKTEKK